MCYFFDEDERKPILSGRRQFSLNASLTLILQQQFESLPNNRVGRGVEAQNDGDFSIQFEDQDVPGLRDSYLWRLSPDIGW